MCKNTSTAKGTLGFSIKDLKDQMALNNELSVLDHAKIEELLSHSSADPDKFYYVKTDNAFTRKARLLQALRRYQSGASCGSLVKNGITYYHPNLAVNGQITGCNFLHHEIFEYAKNRVANKKPYETIGVDRLFNNFLSSQPMAFNLFFPLMEIVKCDEGQTILANVVSRLVDQKKNLNIERIFEVGVEFIPCYYKNCLNDKTAMDAYFRYVTADGKKGIIAIETKYTDILGKNQASNPSLAIKTVTDNTDIAPLFTKQAKDKICKGEIELSQVYRNFLLTETVRVYEQLHDSISVVIAPKENDSNDEDEKGLVESLKKEFKYKFQVIDLETFVDALIDGFPDEPIFPRFRYRYLDFRPAEWILGRIRQSGHN